MRTELDRRLSKALSFEALVNELLAQKNFLLLQNLNALMAYALTPPINDDPRTDESFIEKTDTYDDFLSKNYPEGQSIRNTSFITLNYDCLFERAICRYLHQESSASAQQCLCKHVNYRLNQDASGIEVLKPHGSINWVADVTLGEGNLDQHQPIPVVVTIRQGDTLEWTKVSPVSSPKNQGHTDIVVAHYALGKKPQANPNLLQDIRNFSNTRVSDASFIEIIGVHLPLDQSDDPFLWSLLKLMTNKVKADCQVIYVNPDDDEIKKAKDYYHFETVRKTFRDYVKSACCVMR